MELRKIWGFLLCIISVVGIGFYVYVPFAQSALLWKIAISIPISLLVFILMALIFLTGRAMMVVREPPKVK